MYGVGRMCGYSTVTTPSLYTFPSSASARARTRTAASCTPRGRANANENERLSPARSNAKRWGAGARQPGTSSLTSPSRFAASLEVSVTANDLTLSPSTDQTSRSGSSRTSIAGTTRSGRRTSPTAWSFARKVTSRVSVARTPRARTVTAAVTGGDWNGSPRTAAGASLQSYIAPLSGFSRKYGCGDRDREFAAHLLPGRH